MDTHIMTLSALMTLAGSACCGGWGGVYTLCSHSGELSACCCTAAQQNESTYAACFQEKLVGAKQLIWVPG